MRARSALVLLLILALSVALTSAPAGSAMQVQTQAPDEQAFEGPQFKDGGPTPPDGNSGDDDRWGNARPGVGVPGDTGNTPSAAPATMKSLAVTVEVRMLLGFVIVVVTLR